MFDEVSGFPPSFPASARKNTDTPQAVNRQDDQPGAKVVCIVLPYMADHTYFV